MSDFYTKLHRSVDLSGWNTAQWPKEHFNDILKHIYNISNKCNNVKKYRSLKLITKANLL